MLLWVFHIFKVGELLDTMFIVARNQRERLNWMHVYHHASMVPITWLGVKFVPGGSCKLKCTHAQIILTYVSFLTCGFHSHVAAFPAILNCFLHVIIYLSHRLNQAFDLNLSFQNLVAWMLSVSQTETFMVSPYDAKSRSYCPLTPESVHSRRDPLDRDDPAGLFLPRLGFLHPHRLHVLLGHLIRNHVLEPKKRYSTSTTASGWWWCRWRRRKCQLKRLNEILMQMRNSNHAPNSISQLCLLFNFLFLHASTYKLGQK